jgi:hypothetical protein
MRICDTCGKPVTGAWGCNQVHRPAFSWERTTFILHHEPITVKLRSSRPLGDPEEDYGMSSCRPRWSEDS